MPALGQKQTFYDAEAMSAFTPESGHSELDEPRGESNLRI
jgi:hypothetical protein